MYGSHLHPIKSAAGALFLFAFTHPSMWVRMCPPEIIWSRLVKIRGIFPSFFSRCLRNLKPVKTTRETRAHRSTRLSHLLYVPSAPQTVRNQNDAASKFPSSTFFSLLLLPPPLLLPSSSSSTSSLSSFLPSLRPPICSSF